MNPIPKTFIAASVLLVTACAGVTDNLGTIGEVAGALTQYESVQKAIAKGQQIETKVFDTLAIAADKYCSNTIAIPVRNVARNGVNAAMERAQSKWRLNNFCTPAP